MTNQELFVTPKYILQSRTFWMNVAALGGGFLLFLAGELEAGVTLSGMGLVNLFLRYITTQPVQLHK